jgi:molybdopterin-guanine dinucleotide biosynthesis protein A
LLVTAPCDSPFLPLDLVARLYAALELDAAQLAMARSGGWNQPVFALCRREVLDSLSAFLAAGGRKVDAWYAALKVVEVPFPDEAGFANINTPEDLERLESQ